MKLLQRPDEFPGYTETQRRIPVGAWHPIRAASLAATLALCVLLVVRPSIGLRLLWEVVVPLLPITFLAAPGLWRNVCPLAASNQIPRLLRITRGITLPAAIRDRAYLIAVGGFIAIVGARKILFNRSGVASAALILGAMLAAFVGGSIFKGKSGWCNSICPMLPVQHLYGQTPFVLIPNSHCQPCVGCTRNCADFNPNAASTADQYDEDPSPGVNRRLFAGAFPGLILAFFLVPNAPDLPAPEIYLRCTLWVMASLGTFAAADAVLRLSRHWLTALYGAAALTIFYWFASRILVRSLREIVDVPAEPAVWAIRGAVFAASLGWLARTRRRERAYIERITGLQPAHIAPNAAIALRSTATTGEPEVRFLPVERTVVARAGQTVLEIAERDGLAIEAGCRMGMCGSDPVSIVDGMGCLSSIGADERKTLERLGLGADARMACSARVLGAVTVSLTASPATSGTIALEGAIDTSVERVVVIGNGVAGVTAADHIRRRHPKCEIHVVAWESHHFYNRMAISRLIYGRSAMKGLYLMPESWYDERDITCWLNTRASAIDTAARVVRLGTQEELPYDRLIVATGSRGFVPPVEGYGLRGTFTLRAADDAAEVRRYVQEHGCREAVVVGGGPLGLEAAYALSKVGVHVLVVQRGDRLMPQSLDARGSGLLARHLKGLGIDTVFDTEISRFDGDGRLASATLADGRSVSCDVALVAAGVQPNVDLAREAGIEVARGIVVDDHMRTSIRDVFAAGDVAEHRGRVYGLWPAAAEQAEIAAANALGEERPYEGTLPVMMLKVAGVDLTTAGWMERETGDETIVTREDEGSLRYARLVIVDGRVTAAVLLGYPAQTPAVTRLVVDGTDISRHVDALRAGDWSVFEPGTPDVGVPPLTGSPVPK